MVLNFKIYCSSWRAHLDFSKSFFPTEIFILGHMDPQGFPWTHRSFHEPWKLWKQILFGVMGIFVGGSKYFPYKLKGYVTLPPSKNVKKYSLFILLNTPSKVSPLVWYFGEEAWVSEQTEEVSVRKQRRDHSHLWLILSQQKVTAQSPDEERVWNFLVKIPWTGQKRLISWTNSCLHTCLYKSSHENPNF